MLQSLYVIVYACTLTFPTWVSNTVIPVSTPYDQSQPVLTGGAVTADMPVANNATCQPRVELTIKDDAAWKALESGATVYRVDRSLKAYRMERRATFHVEEHQEATP